MDVRTAIISDVHANLVAFQAVLEEIDRLGIKDIVHAGDVVGYYPFPNEVIALFKERRILSIAGNHDRTVCQTKVSSMNPVAGAAAKWTMRALSDSSRAYLTSLPPRRHITISGILTGLFHGSPEDDLEYIYEEMADANILRAANTRLVILGHTHIPYVRRMNEGTIINPGSVGQPRDGDPRASYIIFDPTKDDITIHRVEYDIDEVVDAVTRTGLPSDLGDRLRHGW